MSDLYFEHKLGEDNVLFVGVHLGKIVLTFQHFKKGTKPRKWYSKFGVAFIVEEFKLLEDSSISIMDLMEKTTTLGILLEKEMGNKLTSVINQEEGPSVVIKYMDPKRQGRVQLSEDAFLEYMEVLPDIDSEISVMMMFSQPLSV